jgi:hypothetical protein
MVQTWNKSNSTTYWYLNHTDKSSRPAISNNEITENQGNEQADKQSNRCWERDGTKANKGIDSKTCKKNYQSSYRHKKPCS